MIFPSAVNFREIVRARILGSDVTTKDVKIAKVIRGWSLLQMKGNTIRRNAKHLAPCVIKVPKELIKLQQDVELAIDCFFVNIHVFFTYSTKICFTSVTHIISHHKEYIWEVLHSMYNVQDAPPQRLFCLGFMSLLLLVIGLLEVVEVRR
jgi:hypothetical protein